MEYRGGKCGENKTGGMGRMEKWAQHPVRRNVHKDIPERGTIDGSVTKGTDHALPAPRKNTAIIFGTAVFSTG